MTTEELQDRARQTILALIDDADKRDVWGLVRQGVVDSLGEDRDANWVVDMIHQARVTITFN